MPSVSTACMVLAAADAVDPRDRQPFRLKCLGLQWILVDLGLPWLLVQSKSA